MKRLFILLSLSLFLYCTHDKPLPSGYEQLDRENKGQIIVSEYKATDVAYYRTEPRAGTQGTLLLGERKGIMSRLALRFVDLDVVADTATVEKAYLNLTTFGHTGARDSFLVNIHPISSEWKTDYTSQTEWDDIVWSDMENNYDSGSLLGSFMAFAADSDTVISASIDPNVVNQWINDESNNGMLLDFDQSDLVAHFYSSESGVNWPSLTLIYTPKDSTVLDTVLIYAYNDVSLLTPRNAEPLSELQTDPDYLYVGNASGYRSLLRFNVTDIPEQATLHHATLNVPVKTDMNDTTHAVLIGVVPIVGDSIWNPTEMVYDSLRSRPSGYASPLITPWELTSSAAATRLSTVVQHWVWDILPNYGLELRSFEEGYDMSEIEFYSGKQDSTQLPVLRVTYSLPADSRFSE